MKKYLFLFFGLLLSTSFFAQKSTILLSEDFSESVPPTGWTIDDVANKWSQSSSSKAGGIAPEAKFSWVSGTHTTRLISPEINLTGQNSVIFSFKHFLDDYSGSGYSIGVSTRSGGGAWTDVWSVNPTGDIGPLTKSIVISNSDVGASDFQICVFLSGNMYNFNYWYLDDFTLALPDNNDVALQSINTSPYLAATNIDIECTYENLGINNITSLDINYQINDGAVITENITGINLATTETLDYTFATQWNATPGNYTLKVWTSNMNGSGDDDDTSNDMTTETISIATQSVQNTPLFEEFTSSTCGPCASFNANSMTPFMNSHPNDITVIKYQMSWPSPGDPYYTEEGGTRRVYYGVSAVPDLLSGGNSTTTSSSGLNNAYSTLMAKPSFFEIDATHQIDGNNISVQVDIMPYITANNFSVHIVVIETQTTGNVGNNGETEFKNVMMKMLPDANGTSVNFSSEVNSFISESFDLSSTHVEEMNDLKVVVFIQNNVTKEIFQSSYSAEASLPAPNVAFSPENNATDVDFNTDITLSFNQSMRFVDDSEITNENISNFVSISDPSKGNVPFTATINDSKSVITLNPDSFLPETSLITISINDAEIEGVNNVTLGGITSSFTTNLHPLAEMSFNISNGDVNVDVDSDIVLSFNSPMINIDDSEIVDGDINSFITLTDPSKGNIAYIGTINAEKTQITIAADPYLPELSAITVTVLDNMIKNIYGKTLTSSSITFNTEGYPNANVTFNPANGEQGVDVSTNILLTFDDAIRKINDSEILDGDISSFVTLTDPSKGNIAYTGTINTEKTIITINPDDDLNELTDITLTIAGNIIENGYNQILNENSITFTTGEVNDISDIESIIKMFPNPANNIITISNALGSYVEIFEMSGKLLFTKKITSTNQQINISSIDEGTYFIKIKNNNYTITKKIVVIK